MGRRAVLSLAEVSRRHQLGRSERLTGTRRVQRDWRHIAILDVVMDPRGVLVRSLADRRRHKDPLNVVGEVNTVAGQSETRSSGSGGHSAFAPTSLTFNPPTAASPAAGAEAETAGLSFAATAAGALHFATGGSTGVSRRRLPAPPILGVLVRRAPLTQCVLQRDGDDSRSDVAIQQLLSWFALVRLTFVVMLGLIRISCAETRIPGDGDPIEIADWVVVRHVDLPISRDFQHTCDKQGSVGNGARHFERSRLRAI